MPVIDDIKTYQRGDLPQGAVVIDSQLPNDMQKTALPIAGFLGVILFLSIFLKTKLSHEMVIHPLAIIGGVVVGFVLLAAHECLHAIVYPKKAQVTVGKVRGQLLFVALASYPMSRSRFIIMCLLPYILGLLPLVAFLLSPAHHLLFNGLMFGMAIMGMISPYMDVYNVILVLKQSKKNDKIMFYEDSLYRIMAD